MGITGFSLPGQGTPGVRNEFTDKGISPQSFFSSAANRASAGLGDVHDDVRLLPRTNMVKRLRSITFMLVQMKKDGQGQATSIEEAPLAIHTLLIGPQSYQQTEPNRSVVIQTLGGAFIDDWGLGLKQITISGTTGKATRMVAETTAVGAFGSSKTRPTQVAMAKDGYTAFKQLRNDIYRQYFDSESASVGGSTSMGMVANRNDALGSASTYKAAKAAVQGTPWDKYTTCEELLPSSKFPTGTTFGGKGRPDVRLKMYYWGNEDYYMVHPLSFTFTQSSDEPTIYRYHIELLVIKDLSLSEATYDLARSAANDPFTNLTDARYRSVLANKQITGGILYDIVRKYYYQYSAAKKAQMAGLPSIAMVQKPFTKARPTLAAMFEDTSINDLIDANDPYGDPGAVGDIGFRDWSSRVMTDYQGANAPSLFIQVGGHRDIVIGASRYEAFAKGIRPGDQELNAAYDMVDIRDGNTPKNFGVVPDKWVPSIPFTDGKMATFGNRVNDTIASVNELRTDLDNMVNSRTDFLPDLQKWQNQLNQIRTLETSILSLPRSMVPYDLVNNIRQLYCDVAMIAKFPELFKDAIEKALEDFRSLLKNSGCAQTL